MEWVVIFIYDFKHSITANFLGWVRSKSYHHSQNWNEILSKKISWWYFLSFPTFKTSNNYLLYVTILHKNLQTCIKWKNGKSSSIFETSLPQKILPWWSQKPYLIYSYCNYCGPINLMYKIIMTKILMGNCKICLNRWCQTACILKLLF